MQKLVGVAAIVSLVLGLAIMAGIMIFNPYGGHSVAGWAWLSLLLLAIGLLLGVVHLLLWVGAWVRRR